MPFASLNVIRLRKIDKGSIKKDGNGLTTGRAAFTGAPNKR